MSSNIEPVSLGKAKSAKPAASGSNRDNDGTASLAASSGGVSSRASLAAPGFGRTSTAGGGGDHRTSTAAATTFSSSSSNSASSSSTVLLQKKKTAAAAAAAANSVAEDDDDHRSFGHHDYSTTTTTTSNSFVRPKPPNMQSSSLAAAAAAASHSKQALQSRNSLNTGTNNSSKSVVRNSLVGHEDVSDAINMHDQGIKSKRTTSATGGSDEDCDEVDHDEESENKYGKQRGQGDTSSARKKSVPGLLSKLKKEEEEEGG